MLLLDITFLKFQLLLIFAKCVLYFLLNLLEFKQMVKRVSGKEKKNLCPEKLTFR